MKKLIYKLINHLGYRIERKRTREELWPDYQNFGIKLNSALLFQSKYYIEELLSTFKDLSIIDHKNGFIVGIDGFNIYVESMEEFHILKEVFVSNDYKFLIKDNCIVIDIGANIGTSSLYFTKFEHVKKIYAFEPVLDTYNQALINFELNPNRSSKIKIKNYGLGDENKEASFIYNRATKGNTGTRGLLSPTMLNNSSNEQRTVQIKTAADELQRIINDNKSHKVVIKMDCEGSEYEILESLANSGILKSIDIWMLEWHDRGAKSIEELLVAENYDVFSSTLSSKAGLIYASRN